MRFLKAAVSVLTASYVAACILASAFVSAGFQRWNIIKTRGPLCIVSLERVQIVGADRDGATIGINQHGELVWYQEELPAGSSVVSVFVYSPFSGVDGIEWRKDVML